MCNVGLSAVFALVVFFAPAARSQESVKSAEDRLLQAELLEISAGDLEKAKAVYQAIQADEKVPETVRARALLYMARCHRKLGEIDSAKKILEDLVKKQELEREILRQARSFLRELQGGKPENPEFNWLQELERNPEIQARVFDLAMDLVGEKGSAAYRQLLALGPIALPVLERMMESTRNPSHRQSLALILLHSGRFDLLPVVLDPKMSLDAPTPGIRSLFTQRILGFHDSIKFLVESERKRLIAELDKIPAHPTIEAFRSLLLFQAGDTTNLTEKMIHLEWWWGLPNVWNSELLERLASLDPAVLQVMAHRIPEPEIKDRVRTSYFDLLFEKDPQKLKAPHWKAVLVPPLRGRGDRLRIHTDYLEKLEERGGFDILKELASEGEKSLNDELVDFFAEKYLNSREKNWSKTPVGWAAVLRVAGGIGFEYLHHFARGNDGAVPEFVDFLRERETEAPDFKGMQTPPDGWTPSARYIEAMAGLLDSRDPVTRRIALEALSRADPANLAEKLSRVARAFLAEYEKESSRSVCQNILKGMGDAVKLQLHPHILAIPGTPEGKKYRELVAGDIIWNSLIPCPEEDLPSQAAFLKGIVDDRSLSPEVRMKALFWQEKTEFGWIDWIHFLKSDDPLASILFSDERMEDRKLHQRKMNFMVEGFWKWVETRPDEEKNDLYQAALRSPNEMARYCLVSMYPRDWEDVPEVFRILLKDPSARVRSRARSRLSDASRADLAPLFIELLADENKSTRFFAIDALKRFAMPESIEHLVKLLDDPDVAVRNKTLAALKEIKQILEEKEEWQKLFGQKKP